MAHTYAGVRLPSTDTPREQRLASYYDGFSDSAGYYGEGPVGQAAGNRRPSMFEQAAAKAPPYTLKRG